jgi:hypothetical protein
VFISWNVLILPAGQPTATVQRPGFHTNPQGVPNSIIDSKFTLFFYFFSQMVVNNFFGIIKKKKKKNYKKLPTPPMCLISFIISFLWGIRWRIQFFLTLRLQIIL